MLKITHLTHTYPNGTRALDDVNLDIPAGMFGLLGPNGAGKSSLMRCLATLQVPSSGSIRFGDLDVLAAPEALRGRDQSAALRPDLGRRGLLNPCSQFIFKEDLTCASAG